MLFGETKPSAWENVVGREGTGTRGCFVLRESRKVVSIDKASRTTPKLLSYM